jgi:hypothetical protein
MLNMDFFTTGTWKNIPAAIAGRKSHEINPAKKINPEDL